MSSLQPSSSTSTVALGHAGIPGCQEQWEAMSHLFPGFSCDIPGDGREEGSRLARWHQLHIASSLGFLFRTETEAASVLLRTLPEALVPGLPA